MKDNIQYESIYIKSNCKEIESAGLEVRIVVTLSRGGG